MHNFRRMLAFSLVLAFGLPAAAAPAQAQMRPPRPLELNLTQAVNLTPENLAQIDEYAKYWGGILANPNSSPEDVEKARIELVRPLQRLNVSPDFRFQYSGRVKPFADQALASAKPHTAVNALLVLAALGSEAAMRELLNRADERNEKRWQVRLHAARGAKAVLGANTLPPNRFLESGRRLQEAALREDQGLILRHHLEAINAVDSNALVEPGDREKARALLIETVSGVVDRIAAEKNNPNLSTLIEPVNNVIVILRDKFISAAVPVNEKRAIGTKLGPALGKLLTVLVDHWDQAHGDAQTAQVYGVIAGTIGGFLPTIDIQVRANQVTPETKLRDAWDAGNKEAFAAQVTAWQAILAKPPYAAQPPANPGS